MDYKGLQALHTIIEHQSFETAADELHITQSAVSQRLKALQNYYGDPLLIRELPYRPTELGEKLLGHYKRVRLLENELNAEINHQSTNIKISLAISRDSLETWFMETLSNTTLFKDKLIEVFTDDQEITLDYLKKGLVQACLSTQATALSNCTSEFIGHFNYVLVSTPAFAKKYFSDSQHQKNLLNAPAITFDKNDQLHNRYLKKFFKIQQPHKHCHTLPSVQGFRQFACLGYAYALIPELGITKELSQNKLIKLFPEQIWQMPVYLHYWDLGNKAYRDFFRQFISSLKKFLTPL